MDGNRNGWGGCLVGIILDISLKINVRGLVHYKLCNKYINYSSSPLSPQGKVPQTFLHISVFFSSNLYSHVWRWINVNVIADVKKMLCAANIVCRLLHRHLIDF